MRPVFHRLRGAAALLLPLAAVLAFADAVAGQPPKGKRTGTVHLVIVSDTFPPELLAAARTDGASIQKVFQDNLPADQLNVVSIDSELDDNLKANPNTLKKRVIDALAGLTVKDDDAVVFYYTGHGAYGLDGHYLHLAKRDPEAIYRQEIMAEVMSKATKPRLTVLLTDCCNVFNEPEKKNAPQLGLKKVVERTSEGFARLFLDPSGVVDITSSDKNQVSMALGAAGSLFTIELKNFLDANAEKADVTWDKLIAAVKDSAEAEFKKRFPNGVQTPGEDGKPVVQKAHTLRVFANTVGAGGGGGDVPGANKTFGAAVTNRPGVLVLDLQPGSPAVAAQLRKGDVIYMIDQVFTPNEAAFDQALKGAIQKGQRAMFHVLRMAGEGEGARWEKAAVGVQPPKAGMPFGIASAPRPGVLVVRVAQPSFAKEIGLQVGDVIVKIGTTPIRDTAAYLDALNSNANPARVEILRGNRLLPLDKK